ncbi:MAG: CHAT domain-containing protein [Vulcanimicrobiota bacterium]
MIYRCRALLVAACLVIFLSNGVAAQYPDQSAEAHAWSLFEAYDSSDAGTFSRLLSSQPELSRKAFIYVLFYISEHLQSNPADAQTATLFGAELAAQLNTRLNDPVPLQVMQALQDQDEQTLTRLVTAYSTELYEEEVGSDSVATLPPEESEEPVKYIYYGDNQERASDYPDQVFDIIHPVLMKLARAMLAITHHDPRLILQELDTFGGVFDEFKSTIFELGGKTPEFQEWTEEVESTVALARLQILAEFGLLDDFGNEAPRLLAKEEDTNNRMGVYFTGYRVAFRRQQYEKARNYLNQSWATIKQVPTEVSPIFSFLAETAEFQLRVAEKGPVNSADTVQAFNKAWAHLSGYKALQRMADDTAWYYGQPGLYYWIEELSALGEAGNPGIGTIFGAANEWMEEISRFDDSLILDPADALLHSYELQGLLTVAYTGLDVFLYILEHNPDILAHPDVDAKGLFAALGEILQLGEAIDQQIDLNLDRPGFPPFKLKNSSQMKTLAIRLKLLEGLNPNRPDQERLKTLEALLPRMEELDAPGDYIFYHLQMGHSLKSLGRPDLAIVSWKKALKKAEDLSFVSQSLDAAALLAEEYGESDNWGQASVYVNKAKESIQEELGTSEETVGLKMVKKSQNLTELGAVAAIKSNEPEKALALLTEGQQMNDAAAQLTSNSEGAKATKELQQKKKQLNSLTSKVKELQSLPDSQTRNEMLQKAETLLAETKSDFLLQSRNIRQKFSGLYTTALRFDPLNLPDVQAALPADAAVVQYFATDHELYIFVVTKSDFRLRSVKETKANLDHNITTYLETVQRTAQDPQTLSMVSTSLYQTLIAPIETDLANSNTLVLIPSGKLNVLPFAPLKGPDGKMLLEKKTLLVLAKPTDFMKIASTKAKPVASVVAFANATQDLPAAEMEGENIAEIFPESKLFKREEASKENLMKYGSQAEVLHLATHGVWDANNSLNNYLKLSNGQKLAQEEIFSLNLSDTSIVTLSACSTALADTKEVEYVASLAEAFWIAGSQSVVASLWPVDDSSTGLLMTKFYENLRAGDGKAEALRKAQLAVKANPRFAHPYFWSGFLLFGDYR